MHVYVCVFVCVYICIREVKSATRKLLTGESKLFFFFSTDLKRKRNAQITVCYDVERRKIQVSMYKTNDKSFLSLSCLPVCSHNLLLCFYDLLPNTHGEALHSPWTKLYYANRRNWNVQSMCSWAARGTRTRWSRHWGAIGRRITPRAQLNGQILRSSVPPPPPQSASSFSSSCSFIIAFFSIYAEELRLLAIAAIHESTMKRPYDSACMCVMFCIRLDDIALACSFHAVRIKSASPRHEAWREKTNRQTADWQTADKRGSDAELRFRSYTASRHEGHTAVLLACEPLKSSGSHGPGK